MTRLTRAAWLAAALLALPARATTVRPLTLDEALARADVVTRARVADARARWGEQAGRRAIVTDLALADERPLRGEPLERLTVYGGALDGLVMGIEGQPALARGDDAFLLVDRHALHCPFVGVWQGVYLVREGQVLREGRPVIDLLDGDVVLGRPHERGVAPETFERWLRAALAKERP